VQHHTQRYVGGFDKQLDTTSNLIQMGTRPYDPTLGRFEPDRVRLGPGVGESRDLLWPE